jgi:hypothetical protein
MSAFITVLYEDQLAAKPTNYGPHILLLACVADRGGGDAWSLRNRVRGIPKKGDAKLRAALRDDGELLRSSGYLVAMFDEDRVRTCYGLPHDACKQTILDRIASEATGGPTLVLLERNMEDLVNASCVALQHAIPAKKPTPEERDRILLRAANEGRAARDAILHAVPSFARLVRIIGEHLAPLDAIRRLR